MKAWMLFVLLMVGVLVGISTGIGVRQDGSSPAASAAGEQKAEVAGSQAATVQQPSKIPPSIERLLNYIRQHLHEADQIFVAEFLGGGGDCSFTDAGFRILAYGSFIVKKVLKGHLQAGDLVSGGVIGCFPSPFSPYFTPETLIVVGRWEGSFPREEELGSAVPSSGGDQIHSVYITELIAYDERNEQIVLQMLNCREAHQVFWVGQPPGTARVVVDPEQPPEGTSVSFSLCITEENFDPERGEVEVWNYVVHDFGFQGKESRYGRLEGIAVRDLFNMSSDVMEGVGGAINGIWYFAPPVGGPGARSSFYLVLPRGRYEPFLSDQDVYVFSQENNLAPPWLKEGEPVDILRGALWIPKPK